MRRVSRDVVVAVGLVDSSGLKFHYTKTLRPHDAGIMELGLEYTDKMALPPRLPLWKLIGFCIPECTRVVSDPHRQYYYSVVLSVCPSVCLSVAFITHYIVNLLQFDLYKFIDFQF